MTLIDFVFPKLRTLKTCSDKCLKNLVSEDPSTSNMVNGPKHCSNLHHITFIIIIDHCQVNWVGKSLSYRLLNFVMLVNTLAADEKFRVLNGDNLTIPIRMQLSQKQKTFSQFFAAFLKYCLSNFLKKSITLRAFVFSKLRTLKTWLVKCLKSPVTEDASTSNTVNLP